MASFSKIRHLLSGALKKNWFIMWSLKTHLLVCRVASVERDRVLEARLAPPTEVVSEKRSASSTFLPSSLAPSSSSAAANDRLRCFLTSRSRATCAKNVWQNFRCGEEIPTIIDEASKIVPAIWDCTVFIQEVPQQVINLSVTLRIYLQTAIWSTVTCKAFWRTADFAIFNSEKCYLKPVAILCTRYLPMSGHI